MEMTSFELLKNEQELKAKETCIIEISKACSLSPYNTYEQFEDGTQACGDEKCTYIK